jgi:hypothetical protein
VVVVVAGSSVVVVVVVVVALSWIGAMSPVSALVTCCAASATDAATRAAITASRTSTVGRRSIRMSLRSEDGAWMSRR